MPLNRKIHSLEVLPANGVSIAVRTFRQSSGASGPAAVCEDGSQLGLSKEDRERQKSAAAQEPGKEQVERRLTVLPEYRWSSWRVYAGLEACPTWLNNSVVSAACGGRSRKDRAKALRLYTEAPVREGHLESPWDRLVGRLILGSWDYAQQLLKGVRVNREQQTSPSGRNNRRSIGTCWS